jgi:predicted XRE-type DNA-binding protein
MSSDHKITVSSGNVFADLGLPQADDEQLKASLVIAIRNLIEQRGLTQSAAALRMGITQPDVSNLVRGRVSGFSLERLLGFARALGTDVEIKLKPTRKKEGHLRLRVA